MGLFVAPGPIALVPRIVLHVLATVTARGGVYLPPYHGRVQVTILGEELPDGTLAATYFARPYFFRWNVSTLPVGSSHVLKAEGIDPAQNIGFVEITVTVQGGGPQTPVR